MSLPPRPFLWTGAPFFLISPYPWAPVLSPRLLSFLSPCSFPRRAPPAPSPRPPHWGRRPNARPKHDHHTAHSSVTSLTGLSNQLPKGPCKPLSGSGLGPPHALPAPPWPVARPQLAEGALPEILLLVSPSSSGKPVPGALLSKCTKIGPLHTLVSAFLQVSSPPVIGARMFRKSTFSASPPPSDSVSGTEPQMLGSFPSSHETCLVSFKRWLLFTCCRLRAGSPGGPCRAVRGPSSGLRTAWPEAEAHSGCLTHLTVSPAVRLRARPPPHEHLHRAGECPQHLSACFPPREPSSTRANSAGRTPCFTT